METCQINEAISKNGRNMDAEPQSLLQRALRAISLQSGCGTGLSSKPLMLFLLLMDDRTIDEQTPMGRYLLHQLSALVDSKRTRLQLIREARDLLLADSKYWDSLSRQSSQVLQNFNACKRGRKAAVQVCVCDKCNKKNYDQWLTSKSHAQAMYEKDAADKGRVSCCASMLQLVYASGARNHMLLDR